MTRGSKHKTALAAFCALAIFAAAALLAPSFAGAQAAVDEYDLGNLPNSEGGSGGSGGDGDQSGAVASGSSDSSTPAAPTDTGSTEQSTDDTDSSAGVAAGGGGGGKPPGNEGAGADRADAKHTKDLITPAKDADDIPAQQASAATDDGGAPVLLIALAVIAAVCTGIAIWRMRRSTGDPAPEPGAKPSSTTAKTQSL